MSLAATPDPAPQAQTRIAVTAFAGMGAIGNTVLATAFCPGTDCVAFPHGIAWITIGREWPAITSCLRARCQRRWMTI